MEAETRKLIHDWLQILFEETKARGVPPDSSVLMKCADAHFRVAGMEAVLEPMTGDLPKLIDYLRHAQGWIVQHDEGNRVITADENKSDCVCPIYKEGVIDSPQLCECSRGFARRMFSSVLGHDVQAEVVRSVIRGGSSCVYRVTY